MHNSQFTIGGECGYFVYEAFCGVVVADDVVANIGVCGNDGDNGVDDVLMQSTANHTRKVVNATNYWISNGRMH